MRRHSLNWTPIASLVAFLAPSVTGAEYLLTEIVNSDQTIVGGIEGTIDSLYTATLNESGQVLFFAQMQPAVPTPCSGANNLVATGNGDSVAALNDPSVPFIPFGYAVGINEAGQTSFLGQHLTETSPGFCDVGPVGLYRGDAGAITKIADESIFDGIVEAAYSQIDESGTVTFMSRGAVRNGVYQGDGTETDFSDFVVIEESPRVDGLPNYSPWVSVNATGEAAYVVWDSATSARIMKSGSSGPVTIAQIGDVIEGAPGPIFDLNPPAINDSGSVAFAALIFDVGYGVFIGDGTSTRMVHLFDDLGASSLTLLVSVNNADEVLISRYFEGQLEIDIIRDQGLERVVAVGDPYQGSTIDDLPGVWSPALNDAGQIAFIASISGGSDVIVRADPIVAPEVPSFSWIPGLGLAVLLSTIGALHLRASIATSFNFDSN